MWTYAFPAFLLSAWVAVYFIWLRPWLKSYRYTMGIMECLESAEVSIWTKIMLWFRGIKAALGGAMISLYAATKDTVDHTVTTVSGLTPADLDPLKDHGIWSIFFSDGIVMKIIGGLGLVTTIWALFGHKKAAEATPKA